MFCPCCGNKMPIEGKFCIFCGANLEVALLKLENSEKRVGEENTHVDIENGTENDYTSMRNGYVAVNNDMLNIKLLDEKKIRYFKENYFNGRMFVFPLGQYTVSYTEDVVTYINAQVYFKYVANEITNYCEEIFKQQVCGWESFLKIVPGLYQECMKRIVSMTVKMMVASGIMIYTEESIKKMFGETSYVMDTLLVCAEEYDGIMREYAAAENIREMNRMISGNASYVAGGFGFKGVLGGMAAAELANAGSQVVSSIKNGIARSSDKAKMQKDLDNVAKNPDILDSFKAEIVMRGAEMLIIYINACKEERHVKLMSYDDEIGLNMGHNTINYVKEPEIILKNLSEALTLAPMLKYAALPFLIEHFYTNKETAGQILSLADFYLQGKETRKYMEELQRRELKEIWDMPEKTSNDVTYKIERLKAESEKIGYNAMKDINRLYVTLEQKKNQEKEADLRKALRLPEHTSLEIEEKIIKITDEANKIGYEIIEEIEVLKQKLEKKKKQEKEASLNCALQLPEQTLSEINMKIAQVREEADKIGYDVSEQIKSMEKKRNRMERKEREAGYYKALELPEDSIELLEEKMTLIKIEAEKCNIDCKDVIQGLQNKIAEKEKEEIQKKVDEKCTEILMEAFDALAKMIQDNNLEDYLHGIFPEDEENFFEDKIKFKPFEDLYAPYLKDDVPVICYDDTLLKSARDGFLLTNRRLLIANMGRIQKVKIESIHELIPVEKALSPAILVNDTYRIPMAIAGKKNIKPVIKCLEYAVCIAKLLNELFSVNSEEELDKLYTQFVKMETQNKIMSKMPEEKCVAVGDLQSVGRINCPKCGNEIKEGKRFCNQCGTKVAL